jgi:hypothetical protein
MENIMCRIDDCDRSDFYEEHLVKAARKEHQCYECRRVIQKGEPYLYVFTVTYGQAESMPVCRHCQVGVAWLSENCGGYVYSQVAEEIREHAEEYPKLAMPLLRYAVAAGRKWKRFGSDELMPTPAPMPSIKSVVQP